MKANLEVKQLQDNLIYTKEAIMRVLGYTPSSVTRLMVWWSGFWILIKGRRPRLYKKSLFTENFANFRKMAGKKLVVTPVTVSKYQVINPIAASSHTVDYTIGSTGIPKYKCDCKDYAVLSVAFKAPACKHVYAVLGLQGFENMSSAIARHKQEFRAKADLGF